jgi:diguanylate cyclase (GGDEF)-like protein/putative nucleotidyltransferase with HDIG domain
VERAGFVLPEDRRGTGHAYAATAAGLGLVAVLMVATGGASSPARFLVLLVVVYAGYRFRTLIAIGFMLASAAVLALPLAYDPAAGDSGDTIETLVFVVTGFAVGGLVLAGKRTLVELRDRAVRVGDEQSALRRVATAVAAGREPSEVYRLVSDEVAALMDADASGIVRFVSPGLAVVSGSWSREPGGSYEAGREVPVEPGTVLHRVLEGGKAVREDTTPPGGVHEEGGWNCVVIAPVWADERMWGALAATSTAPGGLRADAATRLTDFAELLALAIVNTEQRVRLATEAATDPLTGLANHRDFHDRLATEIARARRHGRPLSLALIDIDHFKQINDSAGHETGDRVLAEVASRLGRASRAEDVLARIGGDEFGLLLPETDRLAALSALERARQAVSRRPFGLWQVTVSAGICDLASAGDPDELFRLADDALYWGKAHGRDVCWVYDAHIVKELSAQERADRVQQSQEVHGLRALARGIDAKDPVTRGHSERVAALAARLAERCGWPDARVEALREAALVHDVGKIAVPAGLLVRPGMLTRMQRDQVRAHAELSAQIADEVLAAEQVGWIRDHHERPDGTGYPRGLGAEDIPEGAALLAMADAWDAMTRSRPYSPPIPHEEAMAEVSELAGRQFSPEAVAALVALADEGVLSASR